MPIPSEFPALWLTLQTELALIALLEISWLTTCVGLVEHALASVKS